MKADFMQENTTTNDINYQTGTFRIPKEMEGNIDLLSSPSLSKAGVMEILTSPALMGDFFRERLSAIFPPGSILKACIPQVLKDRQEARQVVSYRLLFSDPSLRNIEPMMLVAKRFADRTAGRREYSAMSLLWENGFNHKSDFKIPRPFAYVEDLSLLIQGKAHGSLLRKTLRHRSPEALTRMKVSARWLQKLHHIDSDHEQIRPHPNDETFITDCVHQIGSREPELLPRLEQLHSLIRRKLFSFQNSQMRVIHGDFQCENIFVDKEKVTVIDFGRICKADPARDLGAMIAQARAIAFRETQAFDAVSPGLRAFWDEYLSGASFEERETLSERTCIFTAVQYLETLNYISSFSPERGKDVWRALLDDARRFGKEERVEDILVSI